MVQVRTTQLVGRDGSFDSAGWAASLQLRDGSEARLERAAEAAIAAAAEGDFGAFHTGLEMVQILHELRLEGDALVAALLYRSVRQCLLELDAVRAEFGEEVARLIDGVLRMAVISRMIQPVDGSVLGQHQSQSDNVRRMLVSLIDDVRIALLKLAERCCAIRSVKNRPDKQIRVAREVSHIYAPLAQRLGVGHIKWELEDLAFRYLQPEDYRYVAQLLDERRLDRQEYIALVIAQLGGALQAQQLDADIFGRPKHIYSIWRKMQHKRIGFSEVFDVRALRVLVDRVADCYAVLGVVHTLWPNISSEFDDYIANPKVNGYQSLHTAVYGPQGKVLEVQIRTRQMHEAAEYGVCAHWQYKGLDASPGAVDGYNQKIAWLRQVLVWHDELGERADLRGPLGEGIAEDRVYVFTPDGHVVDLPEGATPVDFAYYIHTEVGHRCRGAKVNGRIVPLTYKLRTGEQIHILTGKAAAPSRDWLRSDLGYVRSTRTRSRIQQWFRLQAREQNLALGRTVLEREFKRLALTAVDYRALATHFHFKAVEDMYVASGAGDLSTEQVVAAAQQLVDGRDASSMDLRLITGRRRGDGDGDGRISVRGVGNLMTHMAGCCNPLPGEDITGFITLGRGITIHRSDCRKLLQQRRQQAQRVIEVDWGVAAEASYPATIVIEAFDRKGLLHDVTAVLASEGVNVLGASTDTNKTSNMARLQLTLEVPGLDVLSRLLARISQLPNVIDVSRMREA